MDLDQHTESVKLRFSAAAETYDVLATAQASAAAHLVTLLPEETRPIRILEVGCGTGTLTAMLLKRFKGAVIDAIDVSDRMIHRARDRFGGDPRVEFFNTDIFSYNPKTRYPLIVSNSSLHWLKQLRQGLALLGSILEPEGRLVFAIMLYGTLGELHEARIRVAPHKPPLRRLPTKDEVLRCVQAADLAAAEVSVEDYKATYRGATAFLKSLHDQGLTGGDVSRAMLPLTRGEIKELIADYERHYTIESGDVYATYRVCFVDARHRQTT